MYIQYENARVNFNMSLGEAEKLLTILEKFCEIFAPIRCCPQERRVAKILIGKLSEALRGYREQEIKRGC